MQPRPAAAPEEASTPLQRNEASRTRRCLIVDDSRVIRRVSRNIVEALGYAVFEAENGQEALARCKVGMPDLVLLDWNMPVMTGIEFVTALRALEGGTFPTVVFCTTEDSPERIGTGIAAGADAFVTKPFTAPTLLAKLQRLGVD